MYKGPASKDEWRVKRCADRYDLGRSAGEIALMAAWPLGEPYGARFLRHRRRRAAVAFWRGPMGN